MHIVLSTLHAKFIHSALGLRYVRAYAKAKGIDMQLVEYTINQPIYDVLRELTELRCDVLGLACYIWNIERTLHLVQLLKAVRPELIIVLGGPEVSYTADAILKEHPGVDYIVQGEGEEAFTALAQALLQGERIVDIPGIRGREANGTLFGSTEVVEVMDLNTIPFPYEESDLVDLEHRIVYYESSRGCPFSCQYCLSGNRNRVRFWDETRVQRELQWFMDRNIRQVKFVDRTFNCSPGHHLPLMEFIAQADTRTNFHLEMEGVLLTAREVQILTEAPEGRFQIEVGVQSTHPPTLEAIRRRNEWPHICKMVQPIIDAGRTHVHMDLIIGLPHESYEIFQKSFTDLYALQPQALQLGFLKLLQGAGVRSMPEFQFVYDPKAPYEVLSTHVLPYDKIRFLKVFEDVFETFYNGEKYPQTFRALYQYVQSDIEAGGVLAFRLYEILTELWIEAGNDKMKRNELDRSRFLYSAMSVLAERLGAAPEVGRLWGDLVRLDTLISFQGRLKAADMDLPIPTKAEMRNSEAFWKDEECVRQWIPEYRFQEWRGVRQDFYELAVSPDTAAYLGLTGTRLVVDVKGRYAPFVRPLEGER